jgi:hypothetical protein
MLGESVLGIPIKLSAHRFLAWVENSPCHRPHAFFGFGHIIGSSVKLIHKIDKSRSFAMLSSLSAPVVSSAILSN